MHFHLHSTVQYRRIVFIALVKFPDREEAFNHPVFKGNCSILFTIVNHIYLVDEFLLFFVPAVPYPLAHTHIVTSKMAKNSVCGVFVDD